MRLHQSEQQIMHQLAGSHWRCSSFVLWGSPDSVWIVGLKTSKEILEAVPRSAIPYEKAVPEVQGGDILKLGE